ncbi:MAG: hypothetical protein ACXU8N_04515 [Telluria sp.]
MDRKVAEECIAAALECSTKLNKTLLEIQTHATEEDFKFARLAIAHVMGEMAYQLMNPIFRIHPDLKPEGYE